jgi:MFS family permease
MFRSLRVRNYRLYASGQVVSLTGTWMARVTQDWLVYHLLTHDSSFALGVVTALQFIPTLALGLYGGVLGDRYSKRMVLITAQAVMAALSVLTGVLIVTHTVTLWSIFLLALLFGVASSIDMPVRQAFVVEMVGRDDLQNAVSLNSATFNTARIFGPAIAGLLIVTVGTAPSFFFNAVSYLAVIAGLLLMRRSDLHLAPTVARARGQLREGIAYVRNRPDLLLPIVLIGLVATFGLNFQITNALMARGVFHRGAGTYGMLSTAQACGALIGALFAARRVRRPRPHVLVMAAFVFGALEITSAFVGSYLVFLLLLVPIGASAITLATACNSTVQLGAAPYMQGRAMALYITVFAGGAPLGSLVVGWIGGAFGPRPALIFGGVVSALAAVGCAAVYIRTQHVELRLRERLLPHTVHEPAELQDLSVR